MYDLLKRSLTCEMHLEMNTLLDENGGEVFQTQAVEPLKAGKPDVCLEKI